MLQTGLNCADAEKHRMEEHIQACEEIWRNLENLKRLVAPHTSTIPQQAQFTRNVATILTRLKQHPDEFIEEIQWLIKMATLAFEQLAGDPPVQGNTSDKVGRRRDERGRFVSQANVDDDVEVVERPSFGPERWKHMGRDKIFGEVIVSLLEIAVPVMFAIVLMFAAGNTLLVGMMKFQEHVAANGLKNREVRQQMVRAAQIGAEALAGALNGGGKLSQLTTGANLAVKSPADFHDPHLSPVA